MTTTASAPRTAQTTATTHTSDDRPAPDRIRLGRPTDRYSYSRCGLSPRLIRSR